MNDLPAVAALLDRYAVALDRRGLPYGWAHDETYEYGMYYDPGLWPAPRPTVEQLAEQMAADAEFAALELGAWTRTPTGELALTISRFMLTPVEHTDLELLVAALQHAAESKQAEQRRGEAVWLLVAAGAAGVLAALVWAGSR